MTDTPDDPKVQKLDNVNQKQKKKAKDLIAEIRAEMASARAREYKQKLSEALKEVDKTADIHNQAKNKFRELQEEFDNDNS